MTKEFDFIELSLAKVVAETELLAALSQLLGVDRAAMWNWDWPGQAPEHLQINVSYAVDADPTYPLFISLSFNETLLLLPAFEVVAGYELAQKFACAVLVNDPRNEADTLLEVRPTGEVVACTIERNENDQTVYNYSATQALSYLDIVRQVEERAREAA
jgi:hypothetical protein